MTQSITAIEGVHEAVAHLHDHCQGRIAVASGADRFKVEMMLKQVGLIDFFEGRIFSGHEMPRSKPHPDVYLVAAAHLQIDPARCLMVEDTAVGITAGVAAGATMWAHAAPPAEHAPLLQAGAQRVHWHAPAAIGLIVWRGPGADEGKTVESRTDSRTHRQSIWSA